VTSRADVVLDRLCHRESADDANELLREFQLGYPLSNVRRLLDSEQPHAIKTAAWIISELGQAAAPLSAEIAILIRHSLRYARFFALDAVLVNASPAHGSLIRDAIRLINDDDDAVRWKTMWFLSRVTPQQLRAALRGDVDIKSARLIKWLLDVSSKDHESDIIAALGHSDQCERRFAVAAAARVATQTRIPLERAATSGDREISSFAHEELRKQPPLREDH